MNNQQVSEQIESFLSDKSFKSSAVTYTNFAINDVDIEDNKILINNKPLTSSAQGKLLSEMRLKSNFFDAASEMPEEEFTRVITSIKDFNNSHLVCKYESDGTVIADIIKVKEGNEENGILLSDLRNSLLNAVENTSIVYDIKNMGLTDSKFNITLLDETNVIDMFGNGTDIWKNGVELSFDKYNFNITPFYERLSCENGMKVVKHGKKKNISSANYNRDSITALINRFVMGGTDHLNNTIYNQCEKMKRSTISVREFMIFRKLFESINKDGDFESYLHKYFNTNYFTDAYGVDVADMSDKWLSTADTGINVYDFFNMCTWLMSHDEAVKTEDKLRKKFEIQTSNLFFKNAYDMTDVAIKLKEPVYPVLSEML